MRGAERRATPARATPQRGYSTPDALARPRPVYFSCQDARTRGTARTPPRSAPDAHLLSLLSFFSFCLVFLFACLCHRRGRRRRRHPRIAFGMHLRTRRSPPYQLVASLSLALSGAAARPATAAPGLVSTVSDGLMAPTDADETERVGFVLQNFQSRRRFMRHRIDQSHSTPRLARSGQRPAAIDWPPVLSLIHI